MDGSAKPAVSKPPAAVTTRQLSTKHQDEDCTMVTFLQPDQLQQRELILLEASRRNDVEQLQKLLASKVDVNTRNSLDRTALHWAAANGHTQAMSLLLAAGANPAITDKLGMRPLLWGAWFGHVDVIRLLSKRKDTDLTVVNRQGMGLLHCAAINDNVHVLQYVSHMDGIDPDVKDMHGRTALHLASEKGFTDSVLKLLSMNASLSIKDENDQTALHVAARCGLNAVCRTLLNAGADVNDIDSEFRTPIYLAAEEGHVEVVKRLMRANADTHIQSKKAMTPLMAATMRGHTKVVEILLENDPSDGDVQNNIAVEKENPDIVLLLIEGGADIDSKDKDGNTVMHMAALNQQVEVIRLLINVGCNVNLSNQHTQTPLHIAVEKENPDIVLLLIEGGADIDSKDKSGKRVLELASRSGSSAVVDLIIKAERMNFLQPEKRPRQKEMQPKGQNNDMEVPTETETNEDHLTSPTSENEPNEQHDNRSRRSQESNSTLTERDDAASNNSLVLLAKDDFSVIRPESGNLDVSRLSNNLHSPSASSPVLSLKASDAGNGVYHNGNDYVQNQTVSVTHLNVELSADKSENGSEIDNYSQGGDGHTVGNRQVGNESIIEGNSDDVTDGSGAVDLTDKLSVNDVEVEDDLPLWQPSPRQSTSDSQSEKQQQPAVQTTPLSSKHSGGHDPGTSGSVAMSAYCDSDNRSSNKSAQSSTGSATNCSNQRQRSITATSDGSIALCAERDASNDNNSVVVDQTVSHSSVVLDINPTTDRDADLNTEPTQSPITNRVRSSDSDNNVGDAGSLASCEISLNGSVGNVNIDLSSRVEHDVDDEEDTSSVAPSAFSAMSEALSGSPAEVNQRLSNELLSSSIDSSASAQNKTVNYYKNALNEVLWKLATKQLKPGEWKTLARHWNFSEAQIRAIEHQYSNAHSYRDHGYRMLLIWLHCVLEASPDSHPVALLYDGLTAIGRRKLAESVRKKCNRADDRGKSCSIS